MPNLRNLFLDQEIWVVNPMESHDPQPAIVTFLSVSYDVLLTILIRRQLHDKYRGIFPATRCAYREV